MSSSVIEFNILKQFLFGIGFCGSSVSFCFACCSIVIRFGVRGTADTFFSFYNEFATRKEPR